ncbi:MAG: type IX secretion system outer membrane channel protein PorV [Bacteroidota bacterium]
MRNLNKLIVFAVLVIFTNGVNAQDNPIITAAPFLTITPDAKAGAMGDVGAASSPDVYSQYWNPAKYIFSENNSGIGISYTPWLNELVSDIFVGYVSGYYKINDRSALGSSLRYFGLGEIQLTDDTGLGLGSINPNEFSFDISYALKLDDRFSMAVGLRYIQSNIASAGGYNSADDVGPGRSVGVDIAGYYNSKEYKYKDFDGQWTFGWNVSNIGPKMAYNKNSEDEYFIPTNLRFGAGYKFKFDQYNVLNISVDANKLLVPTPPIYSEDNPEEIVAGKDPNVGVIQGIFQSFNDAPDGFSEEMKEIAWAFGAEYIYDDTFALRGGYFHEDITKGARQYATIGFGFNYNAIGLDFSYLISTSQVKSPLENTLRFSLTLDLGSFDLLGEEIDE